MQILKAYAAAASAGTQDFGFSSGKNAISTRDNGKMRLESSGDSLSLSAEACELLKGGQRDAVSACPQDALYDQFGKVTRQFDSLQNDLRRLASQFMASGEGVGMLGQISSMQSQLAAIRAQV